MLPSGLPDIVSGEEDLARFLRSSGHFNTTMVKPAAFAPNPKNQQTSVFRHGDAPLDGLVRLAEEYVALGGTVYGAAICKASSVRAENLDVVAAEPPPRHADIAGWPFNADPELQKAARKERMLRLAASSTLVLF